MITIEPPPSCTISPYFPESGQYPMSASMQSQRFACWLHFASSSCAIRSQQ
jgi:hypothetical protein